MDSQLVLAADLDPRWIVGILILAAVLSFVVLFIAALVSILASPLAMGMKLVWVIFAFCAPFLGSLLWFVIGRGHAYGRGQL
ncbi:PLDc N-terminal domain-containing protein [Prauserella cavernicola]|uniref:PLDc N-terminal domain-containing protein n=1 Tax=Prauserella cavernicola TaxID=2800127 RepID=A0A934V3I9_9PSEU|nr:PLDc N-terminal domain-containing protein [Prauserella cavernicola]MBK1783744.1 PLDc N-terminal domain-containing protein [Prauserella cavernicola]